MAKLWTRSFIMICTINFLMFLSYNMINPTLPLFLDEVGVRGSVTGMIIGIFSIGAICTRPIAGNAVDWLGRKRIFLLTMILLVGLVFSYSLITSSVLCLFVLRMVHGFDWGFASTTSSTIATDSIPRASFGKGMGFFGISMGLSMAIAPGLALTIYHATNYQILMRVSAGIVFIALLLGVFFPFSSKNVRSEKEGTGKFKLESSAILPAIIMGCCTLTMSAVTAFVSLYAVELNFGNIGIFFTVYAIGLVTARPIIGSLIDRVGTVHIALPCYGLIFIALWMMSFAHTLTMLLVAGFLYGFAYGGAQTAVQTMAVVGAAPGHYGAANGTFFIGFDTGMISGAVLAGAIADAFDYATMYRSITFFVGIGIVLLMVQKRRMAAK